MGRHTKHGGYVIDRNKVRTYVVPDMTGFEVGFSVMERSMRWHLCIVDPVRYKEDEADARKLRCWRAPNQRQIFPQEMEGRERNQLGGG